MKACVQKVRNDGFYPVYIRVTHNRTTQYIKTEKMVTKRELSKSRDITDPVVMKFCTSLILDFNSRLNSVDTRTWTARMIVDYLQKGDEDLCFSDYARRHIDRMIDNGQERNARNYKLALQHMERFFGTTKVKFSQLTSATVAQWIRSLERTSRAKEMYPVCLRQVFRAATTEMNDYDTGIIRIKTNPWVKVKIPQADRPEKRAISAEDCRAFCDCDALRFEDITREWLREFEAFLALTAKSANARAIHLRNIRAVFNYAIDEELTTLYPFRRFKIKSQPTPKRSLPIEELRALFSLDVEPWERRYLDMFKLMFFLCGINIGDMCKLREIRYGRVEYVRAKTHRPYSIKVEAEAMEIIERYRGTGQLLDVLDIYDDYHDFAHRMNHNLKYLGGVRSEVRTAKDGKQRVVSVRSQRWPGLSTYWARHSWATIAASLDVPKETIAAALGHAQSTVTDIYIAFDQRKVDEANRRVIDYVLHG